MTPTVSLIAPDFCSLCSLAHTEQDLCHLSRTRKTTKDNQSLDFSTKLSCRHLFMGWVFRARQGISRPKALVETRFHLAFFDLNCRERSIKISTQRETELGARIGCQNLLMKAWIYETKIIAGRNKISFGRNQKKP